MLPAGRGRGFLDGRRSGARAVGLQAPAPPQEARKVSVKEQALKAMEGLPEDAGIEDAIERLYLLYKIERGMAQADAGETISHEEARERMARWLK